MIAYVRNDSLNFFGVWRSILMYIAQYFPLGVESPVVWDPLAEKAITKGRTCHGLLYFLFVFFRLVWSLSRNNWGVCSTGNFAKKIVAIFTYAPLIFFRKMWKMHFSSEIFSWLPENPFQIPEIVMLTWQNREMHYKRVFKWSRVIFITNRTPIFKIFPHFRLQFWV